MREHIEHLIKAAEGFIESCDPPCAERVADIKRHVAVMRVALEDLDALKPFVDLARENYVAGSSDNVEIDDAPLIMPSGDGGRTGYWVNGWLFVYRKDAIKERTDD